MSTKQQILDAALTLFSEQGYQSSSMRQIAAAVGIKAASIYNHFTGKEEILEALLSQYGPGKMTEVLQFEVSSLTLDQVVAKLLDSVFNLWDNEKDNLLMKIALMEALADKQLAGKMYQMIFHQERELLVSLFTRMAEEQILTIPDIPTFAELCLNAGVGSRIELLLAPNPNELLPNLRLRLEDQFKLFFDLMAQKATA